MTPSGVPSEGEYIIGRVVEVKDFGANLDLLEFLNTGPLCIYLKSLRAGSNIFGILFAKDRWLWPRSLK